MAIEYKKNQALFQDFVSVEDAETLLEWLLKKSTARVDMSACTHLHPANLQVLMVAKPVISAWPTDQVLATWIKSVLPAKS
ncbi:hypothetical protein [Candidatus Symbiobacter mobilis]|uniref:Uncharacterized protein n=1 Tax=Candidatus Symbiobacter mobilis CR TaxID=946483 RepID=U5NAK0_9BURK|nr:hypothetical protein [Candidatus Symbiobacter mobilis]AGX87288.1 hypothetical protein Cenrod_1196 [Candidatus Symbiobacter mobilis CR]